jgi:hypothetical protein
VKTPLSPEQIAGLREIGNGADVFSPALARMARALSKGKPPLVVITKRAGTYLTLETLPYFGARLTTAGIIAAGLPVSVVVRVRFVGGGYVARAGRGQFAKIASSTNCAGVAATAAGQKYFGCDLTSIIATEGEWSHGTVFRAGINITGMASLAQAKGGAS